MSILDMAFLYAIYHLKSCKFKLCTWHMFGISFLRYRKDPEWLSLANSMSRGKRVGPPTKAA